MIPFDALAEGSLPIPEMSTKFHATVASLQFEGVAAARQCKAGAHSVKKRAKGTSNLIFYSP